MKEKSKKINSKYFHIAIIILGILFISIPIFHENLWFDESYSVGIAKENFGDIWRIGSNDVHPVLYYWILHIAYLIFGSNIYVYRILSMLPIAILGILGFTHIKKDFGEKVGLLFSFFVFFLPISVIYSSEIRMYTWAMLFVSIMEIYAYRICQADEKNRNKNWITFGIFSLGASYLHYYGLATAGITNLILFIYLLTTAIKKHKQTKENRIYTPDLKRFTISAVIQILLYIPWLYAMFGQVSTVSRGFWIERPSIKLWLQILTFQFTGNLDIEYVDSKLAMCFSIIVLTYTIISMIVTIVKNKKENSIKPGLWAIGIYVIVMMSIFVISLKLPILYARYFLNLTGLFMFFMAFFMVKGGNKVLTIIICIISLIVAGIANYNIAKINYDSSNAKPLAYIKEDLQETDLILYGNDASGFVIIAQLPENQGCFYDGNHWNVDPAYEGYGKNGLQIIKILDPLDEYTGRIWVVTAGNYNIYDEIIERYGDKIKLKRQEGFSTAYHEYQYNLSLIEKE